MLFDNSEAERRFGGLTRLYGPAALARLRAAQVAVVGVGGVGSWAVEALARCGIGKLTLIDLDHIAPSNVNRQIHALSETVGQAKVTAMAARVMQINPACTVIEVDDFITPDNVAQQLTAAYDAVIDCTDQVAAKVAIILHARSRALPLWVCGGAGGKTDPTTLRVSDLSRVCHDALLSRIRATLRRHHGYPKGEKKGSQASRRLSTMNVTTLWLDQPTIMPTAWDTAQGVGLDANPPQPMLGSGLACSGYGSSVTVTATMGFVAADLALREILQAGNPAQTQAYSD